MNIPKFKNRPSVNQSKSAKAKKTKFIGMDPFNGYEDIAREELEDLKKLTMREARIQTENLLSLTKWLK